MPNVNAIENQTAARLRPMTYWWLWVLDTGLVTAGLWFYLATNYGTYEFFGRAGAMALLPLIPLLVLVGGAGSTVFALTKVFIEKRALPVAAAVALLVGPALVVTLALGLVGARKSPGHRLAYICLGHAPVAVSQVRVAGYSTFLRSEWLAVFHTDEKNFQAFVTQAQLTPVDELEFRKLLERSSLKDSRLFQNLPAVNGLTSFKRVFKESAEHQRGGVYAVFDPATDTAVVFRGFRD